MDKILFGKLIEELRKTKNISQKGFADILNVSPSTVNKWEKGINSPDIETLEAFSEYFELPIADFYSPEETLKRLENGSLKQEPPRKNKKIRFRRGWKFYTAIAASLLLVACLIGGGVYHYYQKMGASARCVAERIGEDPIYGETYDFAIVYSWNFFSDPDKENKFYELLILTAHNNERVPLGTKVYRFYYYQDEQAAIDWTETSEYGYVFHR